MTCNYRTVTVVPLVAVLILAACRERAEERGALGETEPPSTEAVTITDGNKVAGLTHLNGMKVRMAETALPRLRTSEAREYAQRVIEEHADMQRALDSLARARNIAVAEPSRRDLLDAELARRLDAVLQAPETLFDSAYVSAHLELDGHFLEEVVQFAGAAGDNELRILLRGWIPLTRARINNGIGVQRDVGR